MKYKETSRMCSRGCGRERISGQRYCRECKSRLERERRKKRAQQSGSEILDRILGHLAQQCSPNMTAAEFKANTEARSLIVAKLMEAFNDPWKPELEKVEAKAA